MAIKTDSVSLADVLNEMFLVLSPKEKDVVVQRFCLDGKSKRTLESIGRKFSVTRERIRQIEKIALGKLRRTVQSTELNVLNDVANDVLTEFGGVSGEARLVEAVLERIGSDAGVDASIIKLLLSVNPALVRNDKTNDLRSFWRFKDIPLSTVATVCKSSAQILKKKGDVVGKAKLAVQIRRDLSEVLKERGDEFILSALAIDKRLKAIDDGYGLMSWRHINPRSIRDKAYIILKSEKRPMHFAEIAEQIAGSKFDKKTVTTQAVHNELIRYDQFVLVGRGLYALKELGYSKGTVADVIEGLLKKNGTMTKQEIIDGVLQQRHVKKGTISLNLQKNPHFVRVGRAVYSLDASLKPSA